MIRSSSWCFSQKTSGSWPTSSYLAKEIRRRSTEARPLNGRAWGVEVSILLEHLFQFLLVLESIELPGCIEWKSIRINGGGQQRWHHRSRCCWSGDQTEGPQQSGDAGIDLERLLNNIVIIERWDWDSLYHSHHCCHWSGGWCSESHQCEVHLWHCLNWSDVFLGT